MAEAILTAEEVVSQLQIYADSDSENDLFEEESDDEYVLMESDKDDDEMNECFSENDHEDLLCRSGNCDSDADENIIDENNDPTSPTRKKPRRRNADRSTEESPKLKWTTSDQAPKVKPFTGATENGTVNIDIPEDCTPLYCFQLFFSDELFEIIARETNRYAEQYIQSKGGDDNLSSYAIGKGWVNVSVGEMKLFFGLLFAMNIVQKPTIKLYWSERVMFETPMFSKLMTRTRFETILKFIHYNDNTTLKPQGNVQHDRLGKVRPVYDFITRAFTKVYTPGKCISNDEAMIRWFGRVIFKTYNPKKPAKYGMKAYKLCDDSAYTWKFELYTGQSTTTETADGKSITYQLVFRLLDELLGKGYQLYMDNYYTSPELFLDLLDKNTHAVGTVRMNRKFMPKDLDPKKSKIKKGECLSHFD